MALSEEFLLELKMRNDIESVVGGYVNLKRRGSNLTGLCPFHNEKTPSFTLYPENGSFYCFGCGAGGDVITFVRRIENLDYMEAVRFLAERAGMQLPIDGGYDDSMQKLKTTILEMNRETGRFFHTCLMQPQGRTALDYLTGRGLTLATIRHFGLGYAPDSWDALRNHLKSKGFSEDAMAVADLCRKSRNGGFYDRFRNRVMFPIIDLRGNVIAFSGRVLPGAAVDGRKYDNTSDTPVFKKSHNVFAMNFAKNHCAERLILVEGQMDAIALHQAGIENAVASQGTAFTPEMAKLIARYTKEAVLAMDADGAGQKATDKVMRILSDVGMPVKVVQIPDGKDPDEFIRKNGVEAFKALLDGASGDLEYRLIHAKQGMDLTTNDGIRKYLNRAAAILADCNDPIARDLYASRLSKSFDVSKEVIVNKVRELAGAAAKQRRKKALDNAVRLPTDGAIHRERRIHLRAAGAEETLISLLMYNPDFYPRVRERITADTFLTDFNRRIYTKLAEILQAGGSYDIALLSGDFSPEEMGAIAAMQNRAAGKTNPPAELEDCMRVMLEEKEKQTMQNVAALPSEDWQAYLNKIRENKKRG